MWGQLRRFLILGSEGGTYYINQHQLTVENANSVIPAIQADGIRAVNEIVTLSEAQNAHYVIQLINDYDLPREALPTHYLEFNEAL